MSYSILYRSMFVKMSNGKYIPMMEMGDNNVRDLGGRRSRSWGNFNLNHGQKFFSEGEILDCLGTWNNEFEQKKDRDRNSDDEWSRRMAETDDFGFYEAVRVYGKSLTKFKDIKAIFKSGIKNSLTFEEAVKKCGLCISYWEKTNPNDGYFSCQKYFNFTNEDEMFDFINEKFGGETKGWYFIFKGSYVSEFYKMKKAMGSFAKCGQKDRYKFKCQTKDSEDVKYLSLSNGVLGLVDNIEEATWFDKTISNGVEIWELANRWLEIKRMTTIFEKNINTCA